MIIKDFTVFCVDPNTKFLATATMRSKDLKIISTEIIKIENMTKRLDEIIVNTSTGIIGICCENYAFYGKVLNKYHFETLKLIGRIQQYCEMRNLKFWAYTRPEINQSLSGKGNTSEGEMQKVVKMYLHLDKIISPEHINAAVCCGIHGIRRLKMGYN